MSRIGFCVGLLSVIFVSCSSRELRQEYFVNGKLKLQTTLEAGLRHGETLVYDSLGNLRQPRTYVQDTLEGPLVTYFESGRVSTVTRYVHGKREWDFFSFHPNGYIAQHGRFKRDHRRGVWRNYSETDSGKVTLEVGILNVRGKEEFYYVKELSAERDMVFTYSPLAISLQPTLDRKDTMVFRVELFDNEYDSAFLIIGDYDEDFYLKGKADTVRVKDNHATFKFVPDRPGIFFVRGLVWALITKKYPGSTLPDEVKEFPLYFEEKYKVR